MLRRKQTFETLLAQYQHRIYAYVLTYVPHRSDADDIMQETAMLMWQKFETFQTGTDFVAWGIAIARNFVLKLQSKQYDKRIIFSSEVVQHMDQSMNGEYTDRDDDYKFLQHCIKQLSPADAQLLHMKYQQGKTTVDIARSTGRPLAGLYKVMARIHRDLSKRVMLLKKDN